MVRKYFDTPDFAIPINYRAFSSNLTTLIIRSFYPELSERMDNSFNTFREIKWHPVVPQIDHKDLNKPVAMLFVDPIIRYFASCRKEQVSSFVVPLDLINRKNKWFSFHFWPQSMFLIDNPQPVYLFKFPEHVEQFCDFVGLNKQYLPIINKRPFNQFQLKFLDNFLPNIVEAYSDDIEVYNKLNNDSLGITFPELDLKLDKTRSYLYSNNYLTLLRY